MTVKRWTQGEIENEYAVMPGDFVDGSDYDDLAAEVARLRALMTEMSKHRSSHIIEHAVYPSPEEYEAAKARDIHLGPTITYTCGIHNIDMSEHDNRCPECDSLSGTTAAPGE